MYSVERARQNRINHAGDQHAVRFYENDALFRDSLSEFTGAALGAGGSCVVVATSAHCKALAERLRQNGIDLPFVTAVNRYIALDAAEMLKHFMVAGSPDEELFTATMEPELLRARKALHGTSTSVVAFGEMVALLWKDGKYDAAIEVERLWDELAQRHAFSLRCAYPVGLFSNQAQYELFRQVCANHNQIYSADSSPSSHAESDRHRMISSVQQRSWTMQAVMKGREEEIAKLKRTEARLQRSEGFARDVVDSSVDCVNVLDLEGRIDYMSPSGFHAFGIDDAGALLGRPWVELWDAEVRPTAEAALNAARAGNGGCFIAQMAMAAGGRKWWDVRVTPARDGEGRVERLIIISRDISELRAAQQAAIEAEKQATAGRMAATIAHEINNPLEAVTNFIYLAQTTEGLPEDARRHLEVADRELARAAQITRQTLGFYRGASRKGSISVADLVASVLTVFERRLHNKQITASVTIDPDLQIFGKDGELRQALLNLTGNAVDACRQGGKLWLRIHKASNWKTGAQEGFRITLADNGTGIAPEVKERVFVPFFTTKSGSGTGIGLWVTKCLVEQQGGFIRFKSRQSVPSGTVMSIYLPAPQSTFERAQVA